MTSSHRALRPPAAKRPRGQALAGASMTLALILGCLLGFFGCSPSSSLERKLEGKWQQGKREMLFQSGVIAFARTGTFTRHIAPSMALPCDSAVTIPIPR